MSIKLQRFDFGTLRDFRGPIVVQEVIDLREPEEAPAPPPPPTFSEEELQSAQFSAKKLGFSEGFEDGMRQAKKDADAAAQEAHTTIIQLGESVQALEAMYQQLLKKESADLAQLVMVIAKKVAGDALDARSVETINALVTRCLPVMLSKPRLYVDLHPDAISNIQPRIEATLREQGFEGDIQFRSNASIEPHDVLLDWGNGQANRSTASVWQEVEALLSRIPLELTFAETLQKTTTQNT